MKSIIPPINTPDGKFTDGNGSTIRGTTVTSAWLNNMQDATIDVQTEMNNVLKEAGITQNASDSTQLTSAIKKLGGENKAIKITGATDGQPATDSANNLTSNAIAMGGSASISASATGSVVIGSSAKSTGSFGVAIGSNATTQQASSIAVGSNSIANYTGVAIGDNATAKNDGCISIGANTQKTSAVNAVNNIAIGKNALSPTTSLTGSDNVAIGHSSLSKTTDASSSIAVGSYSQGSLLSNGANVSVGHRSLASHTKARNIVAIGFSAMENTKTGGSSTAVGSNSMRNAQPEASCCAFGFRALENTTNVGNAFGSGALANSTSGTWNCAFGYNSLLSNTIGSWNVAVGDFSLVDNISGWKNVAIGNSAMSKNTNGDTNVAIGYSACYNNISGIFNTAIGAHTLGSNTKGRDNTAVGIYSGGDIIEGAGNTALGAHSLIGSGDVSNCTAIGYNATVTGSNQVQLGDSLTTTYVYGTVQNRSDRRDKTDIRDTELGLDFILKLKPVSYRWDYREDYKINSVVTGDDGKTEIKTEILPKDGSRARKRDHQGFIAQDVKEVIDEIGVDFGGFQDHSIGGGKDVLSLGYDEFIAPLTKAIQDLHKIVEQQKEEIEDLKSKIYK